MSGEEHLSREELVERERGDKIRSEEVYFDRKGLG
jgi:hypothetical protein